MSWLLTVWFISHCIIKSLASVVVMLIALCNVLMIGLLYKWMCDIEVVIWFLILAFDTTIVEEGFNNALNVILSNFFI